MDTNFDSTVRDLLNQRRGDWPRIANDAGVSHSWLSQFVRNKIPNPGFATLKNVYAAISSKTGEASSTGEASKAA